MKYPLRLIAALLMIFIILTAGSCSRKTDAAPDTDITLQVWEGFKFEEHTLFEEICAAFEKDYAARTGKSLRISAFRVPFDDMMTKIKTATLARSTPDICFVDALKVTELAYGKVVLPLDTLPNFEDTVDSIGRHFIPAAFGSNIVNIRGETHLYGLPAQTTCLALFWNRKIFRRYAEPLRAAGLNPDRAPGDWDEFILYGKALTHPADGVWAYGMRNSLWFTIPFLNLYEAPFVEFQDGVFKSVINSARAHAALSLYVGLALDHGIEGGAWKAGAKDPDQGFLNESYAMVFNGPWNVEKFKSSGLDLGIVLIPRLSKKQAIAAGLLPAEADDNEYESRVRSSSNVGGQNAVIFSSCAHPDAALEFLKYFTGREVQKMWAEKLGQIPVRLDAQENLDTSVFPEIKTFIEQINLSRPMPPLPLYGTLENDVFNPEMDLVLNGRKTVEEALINIDRSLVDKILTKVNLD